MRRFHALHLRQCRDTGGWLGGSKDIQSINNPIPLMPASSLSETVRIRAKVGFRWFYLIKLK